MAVVTLGLGAAAQALLFRNKEVTLSASGTEVGSPDLFGFDIDSFSHPERYALFALLLFTICAVSVANLRRGRAGRRLLAVRTNERAAAALGISVPGAKVYAFALSAGVAAVGGTLAGVPTVKDFVDVLVAPSSSVTVSETEYVPPAS